MSISATELCFDDHTMWVALDDGRTIGIPLVWFPRLHAATSLQRMDYEISLYGLHWEMLDEDISIQGLLDGRSDQTERRSSAA